MNVQEATTRRLPDLKERHLPENCRETINTILKETYGYEQFRNLEIYDDLSKGKEKLCISQGQLIENVILEAEKAWKGETQVDNILLTAPTGSGKSLLFQLPAIYLGKEYNLLTIVVSPLKALIVDRWKVCKSWGICVWHTPRPIYRRNRRWRFTGRCVRGRLICSISRRNCFSLTTSSIL